MHNTCLGRFRWTFAGRSCRVRVYVHTSWHHVVRKTLRRTQRSRGLHESFELRLMDRKHRLAGDISPRRRVVQVRLPTTFFILWGRHLAIVWVENNFVLIANSRHTITSKTIFIIIIIKP